MNTNYSLFDLLDALVAAASYKPSHTTMNGQPQTKAADGKQVKFYSLPKMADGGFYCPPIARVIFNGDATIVMFKDGTKSSVVREPTDVYDRTTAIAYAIVKRLFASAVNAKTNAVNSSYINKIHDLVSAAYDQQKMEAARAEKEKMAQARHEAEQKKMQEKAFQRKVRNRLRQMKIEEAALEEMTKPDKKVLNEDSPAATKFSGYGNCIQPETRTSGLCQVDSKDAWKLYRRPDKPFSKFTDQEKKDYWRYHNAKRRAGK